MFAFSWNLTKRLASFFSRRCFCSHVTQYQWPNFPFLWKRSRYRPYYFVLFNVIFYASTHRRRGMFLHFCQRSTVDILSQNSKKICVKILKFNILKFTCELVSFQQISCIKSPLTLHLCDLAIWGLLSRAVSVI